MNLKEHIIWKLAEDVKRICQPLFSSLGITYMDYARFSHKDKKTLIICSDPAYVDFFLNDVGYKGGPPQNVAPGFHLWNEYIDENFLGTARNLFQHSHGLTIFTPFKEYDEVVNFATKADNARINDFYLNHQTLINKFICYFREQAVGLIKLAEKHRFDFSEKINPDHAIITNELYASVESQLFSNNNYVSTSCNQLIKLSKREAECLFYLNQGLGSKRMAQILEISPRTIEAHIDALKQKLGCKTRLEVLGKVLL